MAELMGPHKRDARCSSVILVAQITTNIIAPTMISALILESTSSPSSISWNLAKGRAREKLRKERQLLSIHCLPQLFENL